MHSRNSTSAASLILQITPEIGDEFSEIKIWQDGNREMRSPGPTSARMKFSATTALSSFVAKINSFIAEEMSKIQQENDQNIKNHLASHQKLPIAPSLSVTTSTTHHINRISFEGTDFLNSGHLLMDSFGLKTGSTFQVEYVVNILMHTEQACCVIA